jgi:hypothetical protein
MMAEFYRRRSRVVFGQILLVVGERALAAAAIPLGPAG